MTFSKTALAISFLFSSAFGASAQERQVEFGTFTTENGTTITVEEDFMDSRYPRHFILFANEPAREGDGVLILRCEQNRTELFFASGPFEFFGMSRKPNIQARFPSEQAASTLNAGSSSDGEAAFIRSPIDFVVKLVKDGSVGLAGSYYSGSFRHNIALDDQTIDAIYELAETCEWSNRLPERASTDASIGDVNEGIEPARIEDVLERVRQLIEEHGIEAVERALDGIG